MTATTPKPSDLIEDELRRRQQHFKEACQQVDATCSPHLAGDLKRQGLQMTRTARRWAAALAREQYERQRRMVAAWMWNAHLARHRDSCHNRTHTRSDYHADPLLCGCFQDEDPGIRQVLAEARDARANAS